MSTLDGSLSSTHSLKRKTSDSIDCTTTCNSVRDKLARIISAKKDGVQLKDDKVVHRISSDISLAFAELKGDNRDAQMENETKKIEVSKEKQQLNQFNLQLQNILYEKNHFMKEIKQCRDFTFNEKDHNLIPLEVFMSSAPAELTATSDPHQLMVNRLNYEIQERKRLCERIQELKARKKALFELNANKQKFLATLPDKLNTLTQVSLPIQSHMGLTITRDTQQREIAQYLPTPLYILFVQAIAFKSVHKTGPSVEVLIVGNLEEAVSMKKKAKPEVELHTSVMIVADTIKPSMLHANDGDESEEDERELRHSMILESRPDDSLLSEDKSAQKGVTKEELYKPFPLSVVVEFKSKETKEKSLGIRFDYLPSLHVATAYATISIPPAVTPTSSLASFSSPAFPPPVTSPAPASTTPASTTAAASASSSSTSPSPPVEDRYLLSNIFPKDTGLTSPNPATYATLPDATFSPSSASSPGLPYRWVQWLTSSPSPASSPSPFTSLPSTYTAVFSAIRERLVSRVALRSQIESLAKLTVPTLYNKKGFPLPTEFVLVIWKEIPRAAFEEVEPVPVHEVKSDDREEGEYPPPPAHPLRSRPALTSSTSGHFADDVSISGTHVPWEKIGARYFRAVFQRADTQVEALIEVATDYPVRPPHFKLRALLRLPSPPAPPPLSSSSSSSASSSSSHSSSHTSSSSSSSSHSSHSIPSARPPHVPPVQHSSQIPHANFPLSNPLVPHLPLGAHLPFHLPPHSHPFGLPLLSLLPHLSGLQQPHPLHMLHSHMPLTTQVHSTPSTTTIVFPHGTTNHLHSPLAPSAPPSSSSASSSVKGKESVKDKELASKDHALHLQHQSLQQHHLDQLQLLLPADNHMKSIEVEVNTQTTDLLLDNDPNNLLSTQIRKLQQCLDVYYEVVVKETSIASGQAAQTQAREGKLCARTHRGRARLLPLVFNESTGLFDQRSYST